jgi:hypothetical protein
MAPLELFSKRYFSANTEWCPMPPLGRLQTFQLLEFSSNNRLLCARKRTMTKSDRLGQLSVKAGHFVVRRSARTCQPHKKISRGEPYEKAPEKSFF